MPEKMCLVKRPVEVEVTVPPLPEGVEFPQDHWRRMVDGVHISRTGNRSYEGPWLAAGDVVRLPVGALVMVVDKMVTGWRAGYRTYKQVPQFECDIALHLVTPAGLEPQWEYHFMAAKSLYGAKAVKKVTALLDKHPPPKGEVVVVQEVRRPNRYEEKCRWCTGQVRVKEGHLVGRGEEAVVEHFEECPPRPATNAERCVLCSVTVAARNARRYLRREGEEGVWETRHLSGVNCQTKPPMSWDEEQREQAAATELRQRVEAERRKKEKKKEEEAAERRRKAAERREAKRREARRLREEHLAQIEGLATVSRTSTTEMDKGLEPGGRCRARLQRHEDALERGLETVRWSVELYARHSGVGPDVFRAEEFRGIDAEEKARDAYRGEEYLPTPYRQRTGVSGEASGGGCPGLGVPHCYHCGAVIKGAAMAASMGPACDVPCFDAMADARGAHDRRWHA